MTNACALTDTQGSPQGRKYVLLQALGVTDASFFDERGRDNCMEPLAALRRRCADLGFRLEIAKDQPLQECERILFWDVCSLGPFSAAEHAAAGIRRVVLRRPVRRNVYRAALAEGLQDRMALLLAEPSSVCPANADTCRHHLFRTVFTWNRALVDSARYIHALLPVTSEFPAAERVPFTQRRLLVEISSNKTSRHPEELYTERRKAIRYFECALAGDFDLYGEGWQHRHGRVGTLLRIPGRYPSYRGRIGEKSSILPYYRFSLCYENVPQVDYVSNRIFDVLRCGSVPIYLGAPNIAEYVASEAYIDRRQFRSNGEVTHFLRSVNERQYQRYIDAGQAYLRSAEFDRFLSTHWVDVIVRGLGLAARGESLHGLRAARRARG